MIIPFLKSNRDQVGLIDMTSGAPSGLILHKLVCAGSASIIEVVSIYKPKASISPLLSQS